MCVCPVLAPHGRPAPPAPATRPSHHQRQAHDHSRRDARAAVHLSLQSAPIAQAPAPSSGTIPHRSATRPARRFTARRARRHAARAGHRARSPLPEQGCCAGCMQPAQQPCSGNGERARWPARAACRRARLAVKRLAGRVALRCGMVPEEGAGACAMGADCSERCTAARASRREWSCACLWWCEGRVAGAGGAGRPWGASTGQTHMAQL